ncbi:MAG: 50S ribosomal protein L24 [Candidatus Aenigmarchaeota archaeon]|nr:50S ribosomal protein L24 [Candidatus Aenigmarchaeota archaeon]
MKSQFSKKWGNSTQPRKQRKYNLTAPLHIRQKFMHSNLSKELREKYETRSMPVRKDDTVKVMRGAFKGKIAKVTEISLKTLKVYLEGVTRKKVDGRDVQVPVQPSNLQIVSITMDDKKKIKILDRKKAKNKKIKEKESKKEEKKVNEDKK